MSRQRYPEEFMSEAVKKVTEKGKPVANVAHCLGMSKPLRLGQALQQAPRTALAR